MTILLKTHKILWGRAASRCAFPDCRRELIMNGNKHNDETLVGEECHIIARKLQGPRGNSAVPLQARDTYDNLILLCNNHHKIIDDQCDFYSVSLLKEMKEVHEKWVRESLHGPLSLF